MGKLRGLGFLGLGAFSRELGFRVSDGLRATVETRSPYEPLTVKLTGV